MLFLGLGFEGVLGFVCCVGLGKTSLDFGGIVSVWGTGKRRRLAYSFSVLEWVGYCTQYTTKNKLISVLTYSV